MMWQTILVRSKCGIWTLERLLDHRWKVTRNGTFIGNGTSQNDAERIADDDKRKLAGKYPVSCAPAQSPAIPTPAPIREDRAWDVEYSGSPASDEKPTTVAEPVDPTPIWNPVYDNPLMEEAVAVDQQPSDVCEKEIPF